MLIDLGASSLGEEVIRDRSQEKGWQILFCFGISVIISGHGYMGGLGRQPDMQASLCLLWIYVHSRWLSSSSILLGKMMMILKPTF